MSLRKTTLFFSDSISGYGWSMSNYNVYPSEAATLAAADAFVQAYLAVCTSSIHLLGMQAIRPGQSLPTVFEPPAAFTFAAGIAAGDHYPSADGLLFEGYGGVVNRGRSDWLMHGIARSYAVNSNIWNITHADLVALGAAAFAWFDQYRKVASPVLGFPAVDPPEPFDTYELNPFIRLRRTGRSFQHGGQGLHSR
jgi:hypothetical protein